MSPSVQSAKASSNDPSGRNAEVRRLPRRRPAIPNGRAIAGGFLVALAGLTTFAASRATGAAEHGYVVATHAVPAGQRITAADLATKSMLLPGSLATAQAFGSVAEVAGMVAGAPISAGELVQRSDVLSPAGTRGTREISFSLPSGHALEGNLRPGDSVDVLATYGTWPAASTVAVLQGATVVASSASSGLGGSGRCAVTLAVRSARGVAGLVEALDAAQVYLVRSTGSGPGKYPAAYTAPTGA